MKVLGQILNVISTWFAQIMIFFHNNLGFSWGISIVFMTIVLKIILFPTSISQIRSMEGMKKIQPILKEIQAKYKDKPEEYQRRTMEVYKQNKVNPFGGCLPVLLQFPILIALYNLLREPDPIFQGLAKAHILTEPMVRGLLKSFGTENFLGLNLIKGSLFTPSFLIMVALSGFTTYLLQKMTSTASMQGSDNEQSMQNMFLYIMPAFFTYITWTLPAGLGIYWVVSNLFSILQQIIITRYFIPKTAALVNDGGEKGEKK
ncbi:MAG TPA: YidC/Oxa1 family membrane protein insertase [Bacteroidales bacterium]|jgi:YidC/Oxa1 family membrane protein insertase|nr:YidC/Oxa1 family membrane protein insertase [Bacteroidales bacterium]